MLFLGQLLLELRFFVFSFAYGGTFWDEEDQSGVTKYWEFQAVGKFIPGTREHRAWGVPIPRPYQSSNEYIVSNVWSALGFWVSALNYLLLTGRQSL